MCKNSVVWSSTTASGGARCIPECMVNLTVSVAALISLSDSSPETRDTFNYWLPVVICGKVFIAVG